MHLLTRTNLIVAVLALVPSMAFGAQLSGDAKSAIPHDVQQMIVVDYRAMQNSPAAMSLKDRVLPPELKQLENSLKSSGLKVDQDADILAFAAFRVTDNGKPTQGTRTVGIAQGQFQTHAILANFAKKKVKPTMVRNNSVYPMATGSVVSFLNQTTMVFGDRDAVRAALDARDGMIPNFLTNGDMVNEMAAVDSRAVWSLLDQKGTQTMMLSVLGEAAQLADYDTVKNRFKSSRYTMDFQNGVRFEMAVVMADTITAATVATLMKGAALLKKSTGSPLEKTAIDQTTIESNAGTLSVNYASSDSQFASLLSSPLFQSVVR
ncbi:MAG: hypothetical protein ABI197_00180 [Granulicella sp.]